jgi:hypothetical protein
MTVLLKSYAILSEVAGGIEYPSQFGELLIAKGVVQPLSPLKRHSQQGLALLGGLWLSRLRKAGLAELRYNAYGRRMSTVARLGAPGDGQGRPEMAVGS